MLEFSRSVPSTFSQTTPRWRQRRSPVSARGRSCGVFCHCRVLALAAARRIGPMRDQAPIASKAREEGGLRGRPLDFGVRVGGSGATIAPHARPKWSLLPNIRPFSGKAVGIEPDPWRGNSPRTGKQTERSRASPGACRPFQSLRFAARTGATRAGLSRDRRSRVTHRSPSSPSSATVVLVSLASRRAGPCPSLRFVPHRPRPCLLDATPPRTSGVAGR